MRAWVSSFSQTTLLELLSIQQLLAEGVICRYLLSKQLSTTPAIEVNMVSFVGLCPTPEHQLGLIIINTIINHGSRQIGPKTVGPWTVRPRIFRPQGPTVQALLSNCSGPNLPRTIIIKVTVIARNSHCENNHEKLSHWSSWLWSMNIMTSLIIITLIIMTLIIMTIVIMIWSGEGRRQAVSAKCH